MSEPLASQMPAAAPSAPENPGGFFQNLVDLYFSPREAFTRIAKSPRWLLPAVAYLAIALVFTGVWLSRMEPREFMKAQIEESGRADNLSAEQREQIIEQQARFMVPFSWVGAVVFSVIWLVAVSGALLFVYRFFYAGETTFRQALAIVSWVFLATSLVVTPLMLLVMAMKEGGWNLNPGEVLQANLTLLLDKSTAAKPLWALFGSLDLVSFWQVFLLAAGFGAACRKPTSSAIWGVVVPWAIIVAIKVGWNAIF